VTARLIWITPNAEEVIGYCARVSSPENQPNTETAGKLLAYCFRNKHWSIFEQASMCIEFKCSRTVMRQILRHSTLKPQEFSQRYAKVTESPVIVKARRQDTKNRQNSIDDLSVEDIEWFEAAQFRHWAASMDLYEASLARGIAKECARVFLPEGNTPSTAYFSGPIRSWIHYCQVRTGNGTQKEHIDEALAARDILLEQIPALKELMT